MKSARIKFADSGIFEVDREFLSHRDPVVKESTCKSAGA